MAGGCDRLNRLAIDRGGSSVIPRPSFLAFALALALVAGAVVASPFDASALAQTREPTRPFATQVAQWTRLLDGVEAYAEGVDHDPQRSADFRRVAKDVGAKAEAAKKRAEEQIASLSALLDTLGPAPAEDAPPEPRAVAEKRAQYAEDIAAYRGRVALAELTMTRAADLARAISSLARQSLIERLTTERPTPVAPERLAKAVPGFVAAFYKLARSPVDWYWGLPTEVQAKVKFYPFFIVALLAAAFGWAIRRALLRWYMRDPAIERPTYARRLIAAGAEGVAIGIVPALILAAFVYQATRPTALISGLFAHVVEALGLALIFFALVAGLVRAALAPDTPAWRLTALTPEGARTTGRRIVVLAAIVAVDIFLSRSTRELDLGPEVKQLYGLVVNTLEGVGILFLMGARQWRGGELRDPDEDVRVETATARRPSRFWLLARGAVASIAMVGIAAAFIGYGALSQYLIKNLLASGVIFGVLYTFRGLLRDLIGALMRSAFARRQLGMRHGLRRTVKFWARAALDPLLLGASLYVVLPWWGVPLSDLADWTTGIMAGFTIGGVTIAPADIAFAILVFVGMVAGTRLLQRLLGERVLPETRLDDSLRHSITAAVGYIGMTLAVAVAVATLGFSLDNLALIAGALSVGIGFGLQNVVNNFVSGIILLIERPVKVGDWVGWRSRGHGQEHPRARHRDRDLPARLGDHSKFRAPLDHGHQLDPGR